MMTTLLRWPKVLQPSGVTLLLKTNKTISWGNSQQTTIPFLGNFGTCWNLSWRLHGIPDYIFRVTWVNFAILGCVSLFVLFTPSMTTDPSLSSSKHKDNWAVVFNRLKEQNYKAEKEHLILDNNYYYCICRACRLRTSKGGLQVLWFITVLQGPSDLLLW